jgi:hypothetical protein
LQDPIWHVPVEQVAVAFAREQVTPQPPQFVSVVSGVSQPLEVFSSQSPKPEPQSYSHDPPRQRIELLGRGMHAWLHPPQCAMLVSRSTQLISQRVVPDVQETVHS